MRVGAYLSVVRAALVLLAAAPPALGQAIALQYRVSPGQRRVYERVLRTDTTVRFEKGSTRNVLEMPGRREDLVVETKAEPSSIRMVTLDAPAGERLVGLEENGQDRLAAVPEARRLRPVRPVLSAYWRDLSGRPVEGLPVPEVPAQAIARLQEEMRYLPEGPMAPGQTSSREVDLGVAKAVITTKFVEQRGEGAVAAAILESSAAVTFAGELAKRIQIERLVSRLAFAADGSGHLWQSGSLTLTETTEKAQQRVVRSWEERLAETSTLSPEALAKAKGDLDQLEKAMAHIGKGELDTAAELLDAFLKANPTNAWTPAIRDLQGDLAQRRLLTQAVAAPRLRLMLRDLQNARDQASAGGRDPAALADVDETLRRVATVNVKTLLMDAADPDPIVRDLAAFGLAFVDDPQARDRLEAMTQDASGQVRGTALIGMAIQGRAIEHQTMKKLLRDSAPRTRGAAALLVTRTVTKDDPKAAELVVLLIENLGVTHPWARVNAISAIVRLAPSGSVPAARALIDACKAEKEAPLKLVYLDALKRITGVDGTELAPFEAWLAKQPAPPPDATEPKPKG
ncbi:MAG: hypothetical protein AMK72_05720 [Planctomycetes bacterium SM23_25]|nr:MAG: hypothetical protein AMK72_05720 [Planctomycetes bacterium SM23_25]